MFIFWALLRFRVDLALSVCLSVENNVDLEGDHLRNQVFAINIFLIHINDEWELEVLNDIKTFIIIQKKYIYS